MFKIALRDLLERKQRGEKGREIIYQDISMADYLLPEATLSVTEKLELFAARTEMNENSYNYGNKIVCELGCQEAQTNRHICMCKQGTKRKYTAKWFTPKENNNIQKIPRKN